ncbi:hypothetical protein FKM82_025455 [Ascaphus truei]
MFMLSRILAARGSIVRAKRRGDKGQPCLVPFVIGNLCAVPLGSLIAADGFWYSARTPSRNESLKPNFCKVLSKNSQLILSNAFSASKLRRTALVFVRLMWSIIFIILRVLSEA